MTPLKEVGDYEYRVVPVKERVWPCGEVIEVFKIIKVTRVITDHETRIGTAFTNLEAQHLAKALNEAEGR